MPLLYLLLLIKCHRSIQSGEPSRLAKAITFLWAEYKPEYYWWEPLDVLRRYDCTDVCVCKHSCMNE